MNVLLDSDLRLTPQKEKAARYISEGMSQTDVAKTLHLTKQTVNRWCNQDQKFKDRVEELVVNADKETLERFAETFPEAKEVIIEIAINGGSAVQLKAATLIFDYVTKNLGSSFSSKDEDKEEKPKEESVQTLDDADVDNIMSRFE